VQNGADREEVIMLRREVLKAAGVSVAAIAAPRIGRAEKVSKLVFVPTEDLSVLDPHFAGPRSRRTLDLLRKSGEFPVSNEELDETATTVYKGI
jgi:hypothetical protein